MINPLQLSRFFSFLFPLFISFTFAQQWQYLGLSGERIQTITIDKTNPNVIYAGSTSNFSTGQVGNLFKTTNGGVSWDTMVNAITVADIDIHPANPNIVFVMGGPNGMTKQRVLRTTDAGQTWVRSDSGMVLWGYSGPSVLEFDIQKPETLFAATAGADGGALYKSINGGLFWSKINGPQEFGNGITSIGINPKNGKNIFAGTNGNVYLFESTNGGVSWTNTWTNDQLIQSIKFNKNNRIFVGTGIPSDNMVGLYYSDPPFTSWSNFNPGFSSSIQIEKILIVEDTLYTVGYKVLARIIRDSIFETISTGSLRCFDIGVTNNTMYIGTLNGVYKKSIITNVRNSNSIPIGIALYQNYPNPFNSRTIISFNIGQKNHSTLKIFNSIGQQILTLLDKETDVGLHQITFDAQILTSGVYFYQLKSNIFIQTKKLCLIK